MSTPQLTRGVPLAWGTAAPYVRIVLALDAEGYVTGIHDPHARTLIREHRHERLFAAHEDFRERLTRGY